MNNNHIISPYHIKNDLLSFQNDFLGNNDNLNNKIFKNDNKSNINIKNQNSILNEDIINHSNELSVIEIKIENDFFGKESTPEKEVQNIKNNYINKMIQNDFINSKNNKNDENLINKEKNNSYQNMFSINEIEKDNILNKCKIKKNISNKIIIKLYYKLNVLKDIFIYLIINIGVFKERMFTFLLLNSNNSISDGIQEYEKYFLSFYNEISNIKKSYDDIINKIRRHSIPTILTNILQLKEQKNISSDEIKNLEEMEKKITDYNDTIEEMKTKYDCIINNFYAIFVNLFKISEELKANFKEK